MRRQAAVTSLALCLAAGCMPAVNEHTGTAVAEVAPVGDTLADSADKPIQLGIVLNVGNGVTVEHILDLLADAGFNVTLVTGAAP